MGSYRLHNNHFCDIISSDRGMGVYNGMMMFIIMIFMNIFLTICECLLSFMPIWCVCSMIVELIDINTHVHIVNFIKYCKLKCIRNKNGGRCKKRYRRVCDSTDFKISACGGDRYRGKKLKKLLDKVRTTNIIE